MKKCPTCQRTFEDSLRFCQNDGAALIDDAGASSFETERAADDDPLQIPDFDPMKTRAIMEEEQSDVLSTPPAPSFGDLGSLPTPEPSTFSAPPAPDSYPPPIGQPESAPIQPPPSPSFGEPERSYQPPPSPFDSPFAAPTQQMGAQPGWDPPPAPMAQWENQATFGANTPFQPPGAREGEKKGLAIAAMICGILSCICCLSILTGPAGLIMGFIAKNKIDADPMTYGGRNMAMAGIITGAIGTVVDLGVIILQLMGALANLGR